MKEVIHIIVHTRREYINRLQREAKVPKQHSRFQVINNFVKSMVFHVHNLKMSNDAKKEKEKKQHSLLNHHLRVIIIKINM